MRPGQFTEEVVIRLTNVPEAGFNVGKTPGRKVVALGRQLEHVNCIYLRSYAIEGAVGTSNLWRVSFRGTNLTAAASCNAAGEGHPITVTDFTRCYEQYENLPKMTNDGDALIPYLDVVVTDEFGADVDFTSMTIHIVFVCTKPDWSPNRVLQEDRNRLEFWRPQQFSSRFTP